MVDIALLEPGDTIQFYHVGTTQVLVGVIKTIDYDEHTVTIVGYPYTVLDENIAELLSEPELFKQDGAYPKHISVRALADLPPSVNGLITLTTGTSYTLYESIDLMGSRIYSNGCKFFGGVDSERVFVSSTGLANQSIIYSDEQLNMKDLTFVVPAGCYGITYDGTLSSAVGDWYGVNFQGDGKAGRLINLANFIGISMGVFTEEGGFEFEGTFGTIAFDTSIFTQFTNGASAIQIDPAADITRRFRCNTCAFIIGSLSTGIVMPDAIPLNAESYILHLTSFSGGGTYLDGIQAYDLRARFIDSRGIDTSANIAQLFEIGNASATNTTGGLYYPIVFTPSLSSQSQAFTTNGTGLLTYLGGFSGRYNCTMAISAVGGPQVEFTMKLYKNGTAITESTTTFTTNGSGRAENVNGICVTNLNTNDTLQMYIANVTNDTSVTVTNVTLLVREI